MNKAIVVLNAGSSSLKFCLYSVIEAQLQLESRGQIEGLGTSPKFKAKDRRGAVLADANLSASGEKVGHHEAFAHLAGWIREHYRDSLTPLAVGHRVVHGGQDLVEPTLIDAQVLTKLEQLIPLAPLHQPHNLAGIRAVMKLRPDIPQVACFDTAFHRGRASVAEPLRAARRSVPARGPAVGFSWAVVRLDFVAVSPYGARTSPAAA